MDTDSELDLIASNPRKGEIDEAETRRQVPADEVAAAVTEQWCTGDAPAVPRTYVDSTPLHGDYSYHEEL